jgi:hypothetical protein
MQTLRKESFEEMDVVFNDYWNLRSDDYHLMSISEVILQFRIFDFEKATKVVKSKSKNEGPSFKIRGYNLPKTMDLFQWGNVSFNNDYSNAMVTTNSSIFYNVTLDGMKSIVHVFSKSKLLFTFTDFLFNTSDLSSFKRVVNKQEFIFHNGINILKTIKRDCKFIKKILPSQYRSQNLITMDLETRTIDGIMSIVCLSYYDGSIFSSFYLNNYDSEFDMISAAFKSLCIRKYSGYRVYFHNLSKFDSIFLLKHLITLYKVKPVKRDGALIELKINFGKGTLFIHDSLLLLPSSLAKLAKSFKVEDKGFFPYRFINNKDIPLNYDGNIPSFEFYDKLNLSTYNEYISNFLTNNSSWNLEKEIIKYCELDVKVLYEVIEKFSIEIFNLYRVDVLKYPTLPSLAFSIFRTRFMSKENIPIILGEIYNDLYNGYTGGAVDVYKPKGKPIYHYDVNSLFPTSMHDNVMPVGSPTYFEGNINLIDNKPFGFFYVNVKCPNDLNKPILQLRLKTSNGLQTVAPVGTWSGWYFSEELYNAINNFGYEVEIIKGYIFNKENIFKEYVESIYKIKEDNTFDPLDPEKADPCKYLIAKFLLNMLYGRFGMSPNMNDHIVLTSDEALKYYGEYEVTDVTDFNNGYELLEFQSKETSDNNITGPNVSVVISSAVTAYSRIFMSKFKNLKDNECAYTDTDSAALSKPLPDDFVGSGLGKMKLEYVLSNAVYLAPKVYGGLYHEVLSADKIKKEGPQFLKIKGLNLKDMKDPISFFELEPLLYKDNTREFEQNKMYRYFDKGYISVQNECYTLKVTSNKREVIYNSNGKFIDTKPFELVEGKIKRNPSILHYLPLPPLTCY